MKLFKAFQSYMQNISNYIRHYTPSNRRHLAPGVHVEISSPAIVKHLAKPLPHGSDSQTDRSMDNTNTHRKARVC